MTESINKAEQRLARAEKAVRIGKYVFFGYLFVVTAVIAIQQYQLQQGQAAAYKQAQDSLARSLADSQAQQKKTQDYIKCVASALLIPLSQRDSEVFDKCGIDTTKPITSATPVSTAAPVTPSRTTTPESPSNQQPTTSAPPDPSPTQGSGSTGSETDDQPAGLVNTLLEVPLLGPILKAL